VRSRFRQLCELAAFDRIRPHHRLTFPGNEFPITPYDGTPHLNVDLALESSFSDDLDTANALLVRNGRDDRDGFGVLTFESLRASEGVVGAFDEGEELDVAAVESDESFFEDGDRGRGRAGDVDLRGEVGGLESEDGGGVRFESGAD